MGEKYCCLGVTALPVCLPTSAFGFSYTENFNTTGSATTNGQALLSNYPGWMYTQVRGTQQGW